MLQETYSTADIEHVWKNEWGGQICFSHGTNHAWGTMLLIKPGSDVIVSNVYTDSIGRFLLVDVQVQDTAFKIASVYSPNNEENQVHFYRYFKTNQFKDKINASDKILLG